MTDIEFARKQNEIYQTSSNRDEMFAKLDKLNEQYLAESVPYNKNQFDLSSDDMFFMIIMCVLFGFNCLSSSNEKNKNGA